MTKDLAVRTGKWKRYIWEDTLKSTYELGRIVGKMHIFAITYWQKLSNISIPSNCPKFREQLMEFLALKLNEFDDINLRYPAFDKLGNELYNLLVCSLASNRTPDEIIYGLQSDSEMRDEVINLLISKEKSSTCRENQRDFLNRVLSGNNDLRMLLNKQKEKIGFPTNI